MLLKDECVPRYASLIYNGLWFSPERKMLQSLIDESQKNVTGEVKVRLFKGNCILLGRRSSKSIYDQGIVSFDEGGGYDQSDASGFIKLNALRLKLNRNK
jgi:argininosuccinate synthase